MAVRLFHKTYGSGSPVIILHGLLGSLDNWHTVSTRLAERYQVFSLDQRNHGRSPHLDEMTYDAMAGDLGEFIRSENIGTAALIGHSMGGKTAMEFALRHPSLTSVLVIVDIAPRGYAPHHDHIFEALAAIDLARYSSRSEIDGALSAGIPSIPVRQFLMKNLARDEHNAFRWKVNLDALRRHYDELNRRIVSSVPYPGPTLFLRGSRSDYIEQADEPDIRTLFPKAEIVTVDSGHWIHAEQPDEFLRVVVDFLTRSGYH